METGISPVQHVAYPPAAPRARPYPSLKRAWRLLGVLLLARIPVSIPVLLVVKLVPDFRAAAETLAYAVAFGLTIWFAFNQRKSSALAFAPVRAGRSKVNQNWKALHWFFRHAAYFWP